MKLTFKPTCPTCGRRMLWTGESRWWPLRLWFRIQHIDNDSHSWTGYPCT